MFEDHSDDESTPYDQSLEEVEFMRSACAAAQRGHLKKLEHMIERHPEVVNSDGGLNTSGYTPLHYASREGHVNIVRLLLNSGVQVDASTRAGSATPLHRAAFTGHSDVLVLLLQHGANAALQDSDGETALHKAAEQGHTDSVIVLLNACPSAAKLKDRKGNLPNIDISYQT
mmetsp:Transcript_22627/g.31546  ORF Transcript_22627/g.31546 Transcript_22627/m.31546 type:complete len:172 (+) Transcript_22627:295-810(+)|eukprot:CAMPEP_0196588010 /NCGR_PEP_ID=MMETSP1081-20130531/59296_1 /TAXON_ID=36882 /ORGANISM="Pyramimonas amylifera, Strain CCMP720" /LENGTH=171 /DNA_ID=CAMNT_0041910373 /DNA_START=275 /DNA_END=790 /DNA_ORIENTATION=+